MILAADIGGTNTRLRLCRRGGSPTEPAFDERFGSRDYESLEAILERFLDDAGARPSAAAIGVAGPVFDGHSEPTNLPWTVDAGRIRERFGIPTVEVHNDLVTTGYGIRWLGADQVHTLQAGDEYERGNGALIAAGTGLGKAILVRQDGGFRPIPSEGGHCDFAPRDALQDELVRYLRQNFGAAIAEYVVSGPGIYKIYQFLRDRDGAPPESPAVLERLRLEDPARVIATTARAGECELCRQTMDLFMRAYGAEASNLAAVSLATGGLFIGGGIAPKLIDLFDDGPFLTAFVANPNLGDVLRRIPVRVILDDDTSLIGAAGLALALAQ